MERELRSPTYLLSERGLALGLIALSPEGPPYFLLCLCGSLGVGKVRLCTPPTINTTQSAWPACVPSHLSDQTLLGAPNLPRHTHFYPTPQTPSWYQSSWLASIFGHLSVHSGHLNWFCPSHKSHSLRGHTSASSPQ